MKGADIWLELVAFVLAFVAAWGSFANVSPKLYSRTPGPVRMLIVRNPAFRRPGFSDAGAVGSAARGMIFSAVTILDGLQLLFSPHLLR
ncbi:MAG: hypothetical protein M0Z92_08645 [Actinomycetota bacterium]|nr:hypothetical protein [Actinomycetota bacterium]